MTEPDTVTASTRIAATPEQVFPYFTDPALLMDWMAPWASVEPSPGGSFAVDFERAPVRGTYLAVQPPHRVVFTWGIAGNDVLPAGTSTVEVTLHADGPDTVVELVHRGLPEQRRTDHRAGWQELLARLSDLASARHSGSAGQAEQSDPSADQHQANDE